MKMKKEVDTRKEGEGCFDRVIGVGREVLTKSQVKFLQAGLLSREASPKVSMFERLVEQSTRASERADLGCCFVQVGAEVYEDWKEIASLLESDEVGGLQKAHDENPGLLESLVVDEDHVYGGTQEFDSDAVTVILNAALGSSCLGELHPLLAKREGWNYIWRPVVTQACAEKVRSEGDDYLDVCGALGGNDPVKVAGFGVELAIKNMEYKAVDDSKVELSEAERDSENQAASIGAVRGFLFDTLLSRSDGNGTVEQELLEFKKILEEREKKESSSGGTKLRAWHLDYMGLQAAQRILDAKDPLGVMQDISTTFPALAGSLSKMIASPKLKTEVNRLQKAYGTGLQKLPEFFVNGLRIDKDSIHLHQMLKFFRSEMSLTSNLARVANMTSKEASLIITKVRPGLAQEGSSMEEGKSLADTLREGFAPVSRLCSTVSPENAAVHWINDIEKDRRYDRFHDHLQALFPVNYFGMQMESGNLVPQYRKNLFHVVTFLDVSNPMVGPVCGALKEILKTNEPVRMGVVAYSEDDLALPQDAALTVSQKVSRSFHVLSKAVGAMTACGMLKDVHKKIQMPYDEAEAAKAFASVAKKYAKKLRKDPARAMEKIISSDSLPAGSKEGAEAEAVEMSLAASKYAEEAGVASKDANKKGMGVAVTVNGIFAFGATDLAMGFDSMLSLEQGTAMRDPGQVYKYLEAFSEIFMRDIQAPLKEEVKRARDLYRTKTIGMNDNALDSLLSWENCLPRYNLQLAKAVLSVVDSSSTGSLEDGYSPVDFSGKDGQTHGALISPAHTWLDVGGKGRGISSGYIAVLGDGIPGWITFCSAASHLGSKRGQLKEEFAASNINAVISIVANPGEAGQSPLHSFVDAAVSSLTAEEAVSVFEKACEEIGGRDVGEEKLYEDLESGNFWPTQLKGKSAKIQEEIDSRKGKPAPSSVSSDLGIKPGQSAVVSSNMVIEVDQGRSQESLSRDLLFMDVVFSHALLGDAMAEAIPQAAPLPISAVMSASSFLLQSLSKQTRLPFVAEDYYTDFVTGLVDEITSQCKRSCVKLDFGGAEDGDGGQGKGDGHVDIVLVIDPLSKFAQRISPLLSFLKNAFSGTLTLVMWPKFGFEDLPLKTYYAYAVPQWPAGTPVAWPSPTSATFSSLPATTTLSTQLDTPEAWLTGATAASLDLDNLKLEDLGPSASTLHAEFEIESLIVSGSCIDQTALKMGSYSEAYPTGVRLMMGERGTTASSKDKDLVDTMVMKNLGYFQLKASPGTFDLGLVPGCSSDMFKFAGGLSQKSVTVTSFNGILNLDLEVERTRPGKADVMQCESEMAAAKRGGDETDAPAAPSTSSWLSKLWSGSGKPKAGVEDKTLNIFSVASGHLYERFLRIMILSVLKNTESPVKFWFIKNYMSPKLKRVLPQMAEAYGFEYELITYKWPSWVLRQTEKQRIIWAYKILFLDVIFPVSLDRVIYVDADQVVRSDLMELQKMDIKNNVYAYTPFCDNEREMDGFRFWKQGFWKNHLRGRNYHISALYLVDLKQFRMKGAGDQLRILYNGLAQDPNSLANLDQDLPNYAQDTVPIFSLPQEWLYCETWCGKKTKSKAKTIDLCNNPMTKEPKLIGAKRIVPEWTSLDDEQRKFVESLPEAEPKGQTKPPPPKQQEQEQGGRGASAKDEL
ncbi:UDP-glucose glycoprotein glucosyltransferase [Chloropicon primus]|uniref:UDP-glucose glycoprotein glucosyltransferase n=2 Tax=Chloropicon primus TaxID=1764295 RepID=A0A5B8MYU8_9CHLO|nr:UDP-glucose glycoprotein glucosyltransferase [Chloropicon primus]|eukprot:QDZ26018.1 UDP-glucose glycoprotein glucosyltransferase [Chloropicon primus]